LIQKNLSDLSTCAVYNFSTSPALEGAVTDIVKDPLGYIWVRTNKPGLYQFLATGMISKGISNNDALGLAFLNNGIRLNATRQASELPPSTGNLVYQGTWRLLSSSDGKANYALTCNYNCPGSTSGYWCNTNLNGIQKYTNNTWGNVLTIGENTNITTRVHPTDSSLWWIGSQGFKVLRNSTIEIVTTPVLVNNFVFAADGSIFYLGNDKRIYHFENNIATPLTLPNSNLNLLKSTFTITSDGRFFTGSDYDIYNLSNSINGLYEWKDSSWIHHPFEQIEVAQNYAVYHWEGADWLFSPNQISIVSSDTSYRILFDNQPLPINGRVTWKYGDNSGRLWLLINQLNTTNSESLWKYENQTWTRFDTNNSDLKSLKFGKIWADSIGNTWFRYAQNSLAEKIVRYDGVDFTNFNSFDSLTTSTAFIEDWWFIERDTLIQLTTTNQKNAFPLPDGYGAYNPNGLISYSFSNINGVFWASQFPIAPTGSMFSQPPVNIFKFDGTSWQCIKSNFNYYQHFGGIIARDEWAIFPVYTNSQEFGLEPFLYFMNGTVGNVVNTHFFDNLVPNYGCYANVSLAPATYNNELYLTFDYYKRSSPFSTPPPNIWHKSGLLKITETGGILTISNTLPQITADNVGNWWFLNNQSTSTNSNLTPRPFFNIENNSSCLNGKGFASILHGKQKKGNYLWSDGITTSANMGLTSGQTHHVHVTHDGYTFDRDLTMGGNNAMSISTTIVIPSNNLSNGSISLSIYGGLPPYSIVWDSVQSQEATIYNLSTGIYTATVTDGVGCSIVKKVILASPIQATVAVKPPLCHNLFGMMVAGVSGGVAPYSYLWSNGTTNDTLFNTNNNVNYYGLTIIDQLGQTKSYNIQNLHTTPITVTSNTIVPANGNEDGSISLTTWGGHPPYFYAWSNGAESQIISNLSAGNYNVTITDANNCMNTSSFQLWNPLTTSVLTQSNICWNTSIAFAKAIVSNGVKPYSYLWNNGDTSQTLQNPFPGIYIVTVTDAVGNSKISNAMIQTPIATPLSFIGNVNPTFDNSNTGSIEVSIISGTGPFKFAWNIGVNNNPLTNLAVGDYTVTVTDGYVCRQSDTYTVTSIVKTTNIIQNEIKVSPNPTSDKIFVTIPENLDKNDLYLYDNQGKFLKKWALSTGENILMLGQFPSGNYRLVIYFKDEMWEKQIGLE
jgi:SprB repeat